MLRQVTGNPEPALAAFFKRQPELSVRILSLWQAYGLERNFFHVWEQNAARACLAQLDHIFFLVEENGADREEIASLMRMTPGFSALLAEESAARAVAEQMGCPTVLDPRNLLRQTENIPFRRPAGVSIEPRPDLRTVYGVFSRHFSAPGGFISWYTDMSHRIRHGCARAYLLRAGDLPASICLISALSGQAGLISSVATLPPFRRRGFASALVKAAGADLRAGGRIPTLECRDELLSFYLRLGFRPFRRMAEMRV